VIKSGYLPDAGTTDNPLSLTPEQVKTRIIDTIDIAFDPIDKAKYKEEEDPTIWVSKKTGRGKLQKGWQADASKSGTIMCSYKVVIIELNSWMVATLLARLESWIHTSILRAILTLGHRQAYTWMDEWYGLTIEDIRNIEAETKKILDERLAEAKAKEEQTKAQSPPPQQQQQEQPATDQPPVQGKSSWGWW